ncbi:hypothetical protein [Veronia pacifica]|uniref:Uncharacterized protein n=2 Tax=Veronia pacifica TaxID=1080227 RepID=A0A1C3EQ54_9GAMM|nr:hypothetical protein A8L45_04230 [Veronia pacifica]
MKETFFTFVGGAILISAMIALTIAILHVFKFFYKLYIEYKIEPSALLKAMFFIIYVFISSQVIIEYTDLFNFNYHEKDMTMKEVK